MKLWVWRLNELPPKHKISTSLAHISLVGLFSPETVLLFTLLTHFWRRNSHHICYLPGNLGLGRKYFSCCHILAMIVTESILSVIGQHLGSKKLLNFRCNLTIWRLLESLFPGFKKDIFLSSLNIIDKLKTFFFFLLCVGKFRPHFQVTSDLTEICSGKKKLAK